MIYYNKYSIVNRRRRISVNPFPSDRSFSGLDYSGLQPTTAPQPNDRRRAAPRVVLRSPPMGSAAFTHVPLFAAKRIPRENSQLPLFRSAGPAPTTTTTTPTPPDRGLVFIPVF